MRVSLSLALLALALATSSRTGPALKKTGRDGSNVDARRGSGRHVVPGQDRIAPAPRALQNDQQPKLRVDQATPYSFTVDFDPINDDPEYANAAF